MRLAVALLVFILYQQRFMLLLLRILLRFKDLCIGLLF